MSTRKANNGHARLVRSSSALLRQNQVAVVNIDPYGGQSLIHMGNLKRIAMGEALRTAVLRIPHQWTVYFSAFCQDQRGERYLKSNEIATNGVQLAGNLTGVIEEHYRELMENCNPKHLIGSAWIANPCGVSLAEEHASRIYDKAGAWEHIQRQRQEAG